MKAGFIGLGRMGGAIAANLLKANPDLTVFNRSPARMRPLLEQGAQAAASVAEACRGEIVLTMLADDAAVREVVLGANGIVATLAPAAIHVSMSTVSVALSQALAEAHGAAGQRYVAAPVFGRPDAAAAARLFVLAAGDPGAIETCRPLFAAIGQRTYPLGADATAANLVKLGGNFLIASAIEALGEAIALVGKGGVKPADFVEVLASSIFPAPAYRGYGTLIARGEFEPAGFAAPLGFKDVQLALEAAAALRVPLPLANLLRDRFLRLLARGGERLDWSAIGALAAEDAGGGSTRAAQR